MEDIRGGRRGEEEGKRRNEEGRRGKRKIRK